MKKTYIIPSLYINTDVIATEMFCSSPGGVIGSDPTNPNYQEGDDPDEPTPIGDDPGTIPSMGKDRGYSLW